MSSLNEAELLQFGDKHKKSVTTAYTATCSVVDEVVDVAVIGEGIRRANLN